MKSCKNAPRGPGLLVLGLLLSATVEAPAVTHYVDAGAANPAPPYTNWASAASTIQDAIDVASGGDEIVVTNGTYSSGGRAAFDTMTNRVTVDKPLTVRSVNGPQFTIIQGYQVPATTNGDGAVRCVSLTHGAILAGFNLVNGATRATNDYTLYLQSTGGGVWCAGRDAIVSNCTIFGNSAYRAGGGAYGGTLYDCTLRANTAGNNGGGAADGTLQRCVLTDNSAQNGGAVCYSEYPNNCFVSDCLLTRNRASWGGGAFGCWLTNCTVVANSAQLQAGGIGGFYLSAANRLSYLYNCIVYSNTAPTNPNYDNDGCFFDHSCTSPQPPSQGSGNITADPGFTDLLTGNLRLRSDSPCIDAGDIASVAGTIDLDHHPRVFGSTVDMGAYEFFPSPPLRIGLSAANALLAWPAWASNFMPQAIGALPFESSGWSNVPGPVTVVNNENTISVTLENHPTFFRLVLP